MTHGGEPVMGLKEDAFEVYEDGGGSWWYSQQLVDKGITPPGVDITHQKVRSAAIVLPPDVPFKEGAREALVARPDVAPASV